LLSPDPEFSQLGTKTLTDYVKAFKFYRNLILQEAQNPVYQAIMSSINTSVFGNNNITDHGLRIRRGGGELEDEVEEYCRMLRQVSEPLPSPPDIDNTDSISPSSPAITMLNPHPTPAIATPGLKERPVPTKKTPVPSVDLDDPAPPILVPENPTPDDSTLEDPVRPVRSTKRGKKKGGATTAEQPATTTRISRRANKTK
jgi:hypothetical protein